MANQKSYLSIHTDLGCCMRVCTVSRVLFLAEISMLLIFGFDFSICVFCPLAHIQRHVLFELPVEARFFQMEPGRPKSDIPRLVTRRHCAGEDTACSRGNVDDAPRHTGNVDGILQRQTPCGGVGSGVTSAYGGTNVLECTPRGERGAPRSPRRLTAHPNE